VLAFTIIQIVTQVSEDKNYKEFSDNYSHMTDASAKTLILETKDFSDSIKATDVDNISDELMNIPDRKKSAETIIDTYQNSALFNDKEA
jgi:hypothetical protein